MIITVTMNPAIDKTVEIGEFTHGGLNRITRTIQDAGGKGINVSKTIHALGGRSIAVGFLGGSAGITIEELLNASGIQNEFVWVKGITRTNTKVLENNGTLTELNEPGPEITEEELGQLLAIIMKYAGPDSLILLSGSIPASVPKDIYARIIRSVHEKGGKVLLDADGVLFAEAVKECPDIIKPNKVELEQYFGNCKISLIEAVEKFRTMGISQIAISMGGEGAAFFLKEYAAQCPALPVKIHSTVGAGDAMVAALAYAWENNMTEDETVKLCMAVSAGAVMTEGTRPPEKELVEELKKQVVVKSIPN